MIPEARRKRGEIDDEYILQHKLLSTAQLIALVNNQNPQKRSVAANILGHRKDKECIAILCERLSKEKSLYTKIAISEALVQFGVFAIEELVQHIGKIGKNRHEELPTEFFKKKSYPLPRDIVIRTIIRMGKPALPYLQILLVNNRPGVLSEVVDAIGHISFYSKDRSLLDDLLTLFDYCGDDLEVLKWKVIRAFQSFPDQKVISLLERVLIESDIQVHKWEALRSLGQINTNQSRRIIQNYINDSDYTLAEAARMSLVIGR